MRLFVWGALALLFVAGCPTDPADDNDNDNDDDSDDVVVDAGDCFDATRNGDESDVDCGGRCDIDCGIDQACAAGSDCMFGACTGEVCVAPEGGPTPTGPVAATWGPDGGALALVTDEGVAVAIDVPAGALDGPITLTFTPNPPEAGEWVDVGLDSPGVLFAVPATLTVTLPPSLTFPADAMADFADGVTGEGLIPLPTQVAGSTATAEIRFLGSPGAPALRDADPEAAKVEVQKIVVPRLVEMLTARFYALVASRRYQDAVATGMNLVALLQHQEDPGFQAQVGTLLADMAALACERLEEETDQLQIFGNARCPWEARQNVERVMIWAKILQHLPATAGSCAALESGPYRAVVGAELESARVVAETDPVRFRECLCETPASEGGPPIGCGRSTPEDDALLAGRVDGVGYNTQSSTRLAVLDDSPAVSAFDSEFRGPYREDVHRRAWDLCHDEGEQWALQALSEEVADGAALLDDVQYCGSQLGLTAKDADGEVIGTANAGGSGPGAFTAAVSTGAIEGGTLVLSGPLRGFKCHEEPPRFEDDQLLVKRVAPSGTTQVAGRIALDGYLAQPSDSVVLQVDSLTSGLEGAPLVLEVWRSSPSCGGTYGPSEVKLFTATFEVAPAEEEDDPALMIGKYTEVSHIVSTFQDAPAQATGKKVSWEITANSLIYRCTNTGNQQSCGVLVYGGSSTSTQVVFDGLSYSWTQPPTNSTTPCWTDIDGDGLPGEWSTVGWSNVISFSGHVTLNQDGSATMVQTWESHTYVSCATQPGDAWVREVFTGTKPAPP